MNAAVKGGDVKELKFRAAMSSVSRRGVGATVAEWGSIPVMAVSGKAGSCLPLVGSLQYTTLANYMYWFPLPFQLPVVI